MFCIEIVLCTWIILVRKSEVGHRNSVQEEAEFYNIGFE